MTLIGMPNEDYTIFYVGMSRILLRSRSFPKTDPVKPPPNDLNKMMMSKLDNQSVGSHNSKTTTSSQQQQQLATKRCSILHRFYRRFLIHLLQKLTSALPHSQSVHHSSLPAVSQICYTHYSYLHIVYIDNLFVCILIFKINKI